MQSSLYASFKVMENNQEVTMTSLEVVELINKFREEECRSPHSPVFLFRRIR